MKIFKANRKEESGAMLVLTYLSIVLFLNIAVLMLDVPRVEKIGRSLQSTADGAALAGAIQLTRRSAADSNGIPDMTARALGWRNAKRAALAVFSAVNIDGVGSLAGGAGSGNIDLFEAGDSAYQYNQYDFGDDNRATITINRGVYERPSITANPAATPGPNFYSTEPGTDHYIDNGNTAADIAGNPALVTCVKSGGFPSACPEPAATPLPLISVADSVEVTVVVRNVPTLLGQLLGLSKFSEIKRTALAVPE